MVEAGLLSTLPENMGVLDETDRQELAELLLSVSSLPSTEFPLISAPIIPALVSILHSHPNTPRTTQSCLTTLYNLSTLLDNAAPLIAAGAITILLSLSSVKPLAGECLATLGNLVVSSAGRRELERSPMMPESLIQILAWEDEPKCQESAAYILMVLAHQSPLQRRKMAAAPAVVEVLLGVALLGSPLAQKRAMKMVEMFRDERLRGIGPHSGPQMGRAMAAVGRRGAGHEGRRLMKSIVEKSLYKNMEIITRRANGGGGGDWSEVKELVVCASSKSLPY